mgnify:CR=1 FL=1
MLGYHSSGGFSTNYSGEVIDLSSHHDQILHEMKCFQLAAICGPQDRWSISRMLSCNHSSKLLNLSSLIGHDLLVTHPRLMSVPPS